MKHFVKLFLIAFVASITFHETFTDNYCKKISLVESFWINYNKRVKKILNWFLKLYPVAPSFGLKVFNFKE